MRNEIHACVILNAFRHGQRLKKTIGAMRIVLIVLTNRALCNETLYIGCHARLIKGGGQSSNSGLDLGMATNRSRVKLKKKGGYEKGLLWDENPLFIEDQPCAEGKMR